MRCVKERFLDSSMIPLYNTLSGFSPLPFPTPLPLLPLYFIPSHLPPTHILHFPSQIPFPRTQHYRHISQISHPVKPVHSLLPAIANHLPPLHRPGCLAYARVSETHFFPFLKGGGLTRCGDHVFEIGIRWGGWNRGGEDEGEEGEEEEGWGEEGDVHFIFFAREG